jgi:hypothetical protein
MTDDQNIAHTALSIVHSFLCPDAARQVRQSIP